MTHRLTTGRAPWGRNPPATALRAGGAKEVRQVERVRGKRRGPRPPSLAWEGGRGPRGHSRRAGLFLVAWGPGRVRREVFVAHAVGDEGVVQGLVGVLVPVRG